MDLTTAITQARALLSEQLRLELERHAREMFALESRLATVHRPRSERDLMRVVGVLLDIGLLPTEEHWQPAPRTLAKLGTIHAVRREA